MHAKTRPEPSGLASPAPSAPPAAPLDWPSEIRLTISPNPATMVIKTVPSRSPVGTDRQELKPDRAPSGLGILANDEDSYNPTHPGDQSAIVELEQGVADYGRFMRLLALAPNSLYNTIVSAQAEYEKLQLEHHRTDAVTEPLRPAEVEHPDELMHTKYNALKERYDYAVEVAKDYAYALRCLRLHEPTPAGPKVLAFNGNSNQTQNHQSGFACESIEGGIDSQTSKSTYLPNPDKLSDGIDPTFQSWLIDMRGKLIFNADHYSTEQHKIIYVASRTAGAAHNHLNGRLSQDGFVPYTKAEDVFEDLKEIFDDDSIEYSLEDMKTSDDFHAYLWKFLHRAGAQGRPYVSLKFALGMRLPERLMTAVEPGLYHDLVTFEEFALSCVEEAGQLDMEWEPEPDFAW